MDRMNTARSCAAGFPSCDPTAPTLRYPVSGAIPSAGSDTIRWVPKSGRESLTTKKEVIDHDRH